ncbi:MAG TPA: transposase, partial [Phormidium sp.]
AYAENFFQLWVWDELDNTLSNCSDPKETGKNFKEILKQCHHTGVGWIVSGQSVMTSQIPGFMDDDRELFTQIIIGTSKIRKYLEKYGKKILSAKVVTQLLKNLDDLDPYIEDKNSMVTDAARLLRLGLVLDDKSPKLYFLPNLDATKFDAEKFENVITQAEQMKRQFLVRTSGGKGEGWLKDAENPYGVRIGEMAANPPFPTIGGSDHFTQSSQIPHCPHCGESNLKTIENGKRYQCRGCTKRFVTSKVVWK